MTIADNLAAARNSITDEDLLMHLLTGLGLEYEYVVVMISGKEEPVDINYAVSMLLTHECIIDKKNASNISDAGENFTANYIQATYNQKKGNDVANGYNQGSGYGRGKNSQNQQRFNTNYHQ